MLEPRGVCPPFPVAARAGGRHYEPSALDLPSRDLRFIKAQGTTKRAGMSRRFSCLGRITK